MNVLLVNPNTVQSPPVPPIGLEYLAACISAAGHHVRILDLCFSDNAASDIDAAVHEFRPDIAGVTVRNVDSVLFSHNEFYLDSIREIIRGIKSRHGFTVITGGSGVSANPEGMLEYLGSDILIAGPAEGIIADVLEATMKGKNERSVYDGTRKPGPYCSRVISGISYRKYFDAGGIAGFETHKGCSSSCVYCLEANTPVSFKRPSDVVQEIRELVDQGFNHFHLCDSEFNEDLDQALDFCSALKKSGLGISWALYMKPANYNQKLFRLLKESGAYLITLTADSFKKCPLYWSDIEKIVFSARSNGIRLAVDFLTGFPYEDAGHLKWCLDFFRRLQPDRVNVNTHIRLYKSLQITKLIMNDESLRARLLGNTDDESLIRPVFYNHIDAKTLEGLIAGEDLFKIEGTESGVNYSRIAPKRPASVYRKQ